MNAPSDHLIVDVLAHVQEVKEALNKGELTVRDIDAGKDIPLQESLGRAEKKLEELYRRAVGFYDEEDK